jgi:uncharacterized protein (DUF1330 family)
MAGYILLDLEITDPEGFQEYLKLAGPTVKQYGGKVLVGGAVPENLEGDWHPRLFSIGEFESVEQALRWYNSEEYAPAKAHRGPTPSIPRLLWQPLRSSQRRSVLKRRPL